MQKTFFLAFYSLVRLSLNIQDKFLRLKLVKKIYNLLSNHTQLAVFQEDVAQYLQLRKNTIRILDEITELVDLFVYLKTVELSPALTIQKNILNLKSKLLDFKPKIKTVKSSGFVQKEDVLEKVADEKKSKKIKQGKQEKEILDFVKNSQGSYAKDILNFFAGRVSKRTLQRHLNKLVANGVIFKKISGSYPKYYISGIDTDQTQ